MFKKKTVYILILLTIITSLFIPKTRLAVYRIAGDFFFPFISMISNLGSYVDKKNDIRKSKAALIDEIVELRRQNTVLAAKVSTNELLRKENLELHSLLKLKSNAFYQYVFSEIISRDPVLWFQQFTINKGKNNGVENGALVIAGISSNESVNIDFAVVGRISAVSNHSAVVDTILNRDCRLSVIIPENGATGILTGGGRDGNEIWTEIVYLPRDLQYKAGSFVQTSGLNKFIPLALKVGRIMGEQEADIDIYNDLYVKARVKPTVDFNHLAFVLVLVKK